jgi:hypothetical protein
VELLEKFYDNNKKFKHEIESLIEPFKSLFLKKLRNEKNEMNFLSTISEFRFTQFFLSNNFDLAYEPKLNGKTPDFIINDFSAICEVKKFNISEFDQNNSDRLYELFKKIGTLESEIYVAIEQLSPCLEFHTDTVVNEFSNWLISAKRNNRENFIYQNQIKLEILKVDTGHPKILTMISPENPKIHPFKIESDILEKLNKYEELSKKQPLIICVDLPFVTLRDPLDYWLKFLGGSILFIDSNIQAFFLGEFYENMKYNSLSGILIRYNLKFYWLKNPRSEFNIPFQNVVDLYDPQSNSYKNHNAI